jgi:ribosomal protein S27AE
MCIIKEECDKLATKQIEYCFECTDFPCANLKTLDNRYREKYGMSMTENLSYIKAKGIKQFLKNEQERWKCPNCGGVICVHNKKCYTCNQTGKTKF